VHCLTQFLQLPFGGTRMQLIPTLSPEGMCGYLALFTILQDMQCMMIPDTEHVLLRLQLCDHAPAWIDIANQALEMGYGVSNLVALNTFAFATRLLFLECLKEDVWSLSFWLVPCQIHNRLRSAIRIPTVCPKTEHCVSKPTTYFIQSCFTLGSFLWCSVMACVRARPAPMVGKDPYGKILHAAKVLPFNSTF